MLRRTSLRTVMWGVVAVALLSIAIGLCITVYDAHRFSQSHGCQCFLKGIGLALRSYHQHYGCFPPAHLCDKDGKPLNSWRTLIVHNYWYSFRDSGYDLTHPWNAPKNAGLKLDDYPIRGYRCPSEGDSRSPLTDYVAIVGSNTMWPGCQPAKQAADGSDKDKILVIEVMNSDIRWVEPRDLTLEQALDAIQPKQGIGIGSRHRDGIHYVTVGGDVRTLEPTIDREALRKLLIRD